MVECEDCQNLMSADAFRHAVEEEDPFECTSCGQALPQRARSLIIYRMSDGALSRTKPAVNSMPATPTTAAEAAVEVQEQSISVDVSTFTVRAHGRCHTFPDRSKLLFALFERINRRPGHRVSFDTLRQKDDVWDGVEVEDTTIRGAVFRLKKALKASGMAELASAISTGTFQNRSYVILHANKLTSN